MSALRRRAAFTLLEVIAVVLILGMVFLVMGAVYRDIVGPTMTSPNQTEAVRRGLLLIDRVAEDLEGAVLIEKPKETDPLAHPWLFYADSRLGHNGADRLKFDSRNARPAGEHASDLAVVAYWLEPAESEGLRLVRWTSSALPESLDREFPRSTDDGARVIANGIARFGVRFTAEDGAVVTAWDSSTLERSSQLPIAAEIQFAMLDPTAKEGERVFAKRVVFPLRPLDLEKLLSGDEAGGDEDQDDDGDGDDGCVTVGECQTANASAFAAAIASSPDPAGVQSALDAVRDQCWEDVAAGFDLQVGGCE